MSKKNMERELLFCDNHVLTRADIDHIIDTIKNSPPHISIAEMQKYTVSPEARAVLTEAIRRFEYERVKPVIRKRVESQINSITADPLPPAWAASVLTLLAGSRRAEAAIGDLNERFARECTEVGPSRARLLYSVRTVRSIWPLLQRVLVKVGVWAAIISGVKRYFAG